VRDVECFVQSTSLEDLLAMQVDGPPLRVYVTRIASGNKTVCAVMINAAAVAFGWPAVTPMYAMMPPNLEHGASPDLAWPEDAEQLRHISKSTMPVSTRTVMMAVGFTSGNMIKLAQPVTVRGRTFPANTLVTKVLKGVSVLTCNTWPITTIRQKSYLHQTLHQTNWSAYAQLVMLA
jgi:hypothetical protein